MRVKNYNKFRIFDYENHFSVNDKFHLGDIVYKHTKIMRDYVESPEIGVIIQVWSEDEFRTDMFGNCSSSEIRLAEIDDVKLYRPDIIDDIVNV